MKMDADARLPIATTDNVNKYNFPHCPSLTFFRVAVVPGRTKALWIR
jgi:hypothetical protein